MLFWLALFGVGTVLAGVYVANDERKARAEKLKKIQRELARREAAEVSQENGDAQN